MTSPSSALHRRARGTMRRRVMTAQEISIKGAFGVAPGYLLMFLMLVFPSVYAFIWVKTALFGWVVIAAAFSVLQNGVRIQRTIIVIALGEAAISLLFVTIGFARSAPGAQPCLLVYVMWPLVYTLLLTGTTSRRVLSSIDVVVLFSTAVASIFVMLLFLGRIGIIPQLQVFDLLDQGQAVGLHTGYVQVNILALNSMPYLICFAIASAVIRAVFPSAVGRSTRWATALRWACVILGLGCVTVSGRRGLQLVTL